MKKLALLPDYRQEAWPSMDLCAEMLRDHFPQEILSAKMLLPPWRRLPLPGRVRLNAERLFNRFVMYPSFVRAQRKLFDCFHIVDHSYGQLLHHLPPEVTGIFCYDLEAFRCLLQPEEVRRSRWFRQMMRKVLTGFVKAEVIFYATDAVRHEIEKFGLVSPNRLVKVPLGVSPEYTPQPKDKAEPPFLLHVGSCVPRKRIDVLLKVFAGVSARWPELQLVQIGGEFTAEHQSLIERFNLSSRIRQLRRLSREELAGWYSRAEMVLQPSDAEGFGLPVIEALACGATVVASDLPVLKEVGEEAVTYCPVGQPEIWVDTLNRLREGSLPKPAEEARQRVLARYSWENHARIIARSYLRLIS